MRQSHLLTRGAGFSARWKQLYAAAIFELDDAKLTDRIAQARAAMRETADSNPTDEERRTLTDGLRILRVLENMSPKKIVPHKSDNRRDADATFRTGSSHHK